MMKKKKVQKSNKNPTKLKSRAHAVVNDSLSAPAPNKNSDEVVVQQLKQLPGTRTKILKIIYDKKAEIVAQRRRILVYRLILTVAILFVLFLAAGSAYQTLSQVSILRPVKTFIVQQWWPTLTQPPGNSKATPKKHKPSRSAKPLNNKKKTYKNALKIQRGTPKRARP